MISVSSRDVFFGGHLKQSVKDALKQYAKEHNISMSSFMAQAIEEKLKAEGVVIIEQPIYSGEPLPLSGTLV